MEIANSKTTKKIETVVERVGFADKLKMSAIAALGIPFHDVADAVRLCNDLKERVMIDVYSDDELYGWNWSLSGREYLQYYGTESHREIFGQEFWIDALLPRPRSVGNNSIELCRRFPNADVIVITDVRFSNEAERILDLGGEVWQIDVEDRLGPLAPNAHISECPLPDECLTRTVDNNGDLDHFRRRLEIAYSDMQRVMLRGD